VRVLVTGAAGLLGRWFVSHHLNNGDEVVGVDDLSSPFSHWPEALHPRQRFTNELGFWLRGHEYDRKMLFDRAYHFAAPVGGRVKIEQDPLFNAGSFGIDAAFIGWCVNRVDTLVYPSSSAVYPVDDQTVGFHHSLSEDLFNPAVPGTTKVWGKPDEVYGLTKLVGEVLAWKAAVFGLKTLCIRPFSGYAEDQGLDYPVAAIADRVARHEDPIKIWGAGDQTRDFVHVSDIVAATEARLADGIYNGYAAMNIGSGIPTSFRTIAVRLMALEGFEAPIVTDELMPEGVKHRYADVEEMARYYVPQVDLMTGLERVLAYRHTSRRMGR
jgi:nucleoside-diphosphate-sugar epimerase